MIEDPAPREERGGEGAGGEGGCTGLGGSGEVGLVCCHIFYSSLGLYEVTCLACG